MTTTKPLRIGRTTVEPGDASEYLAGTHIMVYDPSAPLETYIKGMFGHVGAPDERESRRNAVLFANAALLRERLRALCIAVRKEQDEHAEREKLDLLDTTALAALSMAERTLEDLDNQLGE